MKVLFYYKNFFLVHISLVPGHISSVKINALNVCCFRHMALRFCNE